MPERGSTTRSIALRRLLIDARTAKGLKQSDLAKLLGRPQSFVSNVERGQRRLGVVEFIDFAHALDLDPRAVVAELAAN
jgi:transcriptional regulator with XRE-family HTH domain